MSIKDLIVVGLLLYTSVTSPAISKSITDPKSDLASFEDSDMYKDRSLKNCHTAYCRALSNASQAWDLLLHRDRPNSMAQLKPHPDSFFTNSERNAARLVASLPDPLLTCFVLKKMILELPVCFDDHLSFLELMELVSELPSRAAECRDGIAAAMPDTAKSAEWLKDADEFIQSDVESDPALRRWVHPSAVAPRP